MVSALSPLFQNSQIGWRVILRIVSAIPRKVRAVLPKALWPKRFVGNARIHCTEVG
jgi:hypothetical protein